MATAKRIAAAVALVLAAVAFLSGIVTGFAAPGRAPGRRHPGRVTMASYNTLVGLGHEHQGQRKAHMAALAASPGQPCPHVSKCGGAPMYATRAEARQAGLPPVLWDLDLDDYPGRIFGGPQVKRLAHRHCNRSAGQNVGAQLRRLGIKRAIQKPRRRTTSRNRRSRW